MPAAPRAPAPATPPGATLADWLSLHRVTAADLAQVLDPWPAPPPAPDLPRDRPATLAATLAEVLAPLAAALPPLAPLIARLPEVARIDFAPDPARFPRAFTLDDDGTGRPLVSVPLRGRASDLLVLAHELGHALQALGPGPAVPPIQRETAAFLAEHALTAARPDLAALRARRHARMDRHAAALQIALADPAAPYAYDWNYPVALRLAARASALPAPDIAALITAPGDLGPLLRRFAR